MSWRNFASVLTLSMAATIVFGCGKDSTGSRGGSSSSGGSGATPLGDGGTTASGGSGATTGGTSGGDTANTGGSDIAAGGDPSGGAGSPNATGGAATNTGGSDIAAGGVAASGGDDAGGTGGPNTDTGGATLGTGGVSGSAGGERGGASSTTGGDGGTSSNSSGGAAGAISCEPGSGFLGQLTGAGSEIPNGGVFTNETGSVVYGNANLQGVVDAFPPPDDNIAVDVDVDGAVVVATVAQTSDPVPQARADFWVADENQILSVHLDRTQGPSCCPSFDLRTGMELSFKVTRVNVAFSLGVVVEATDFVAGDQDRCVSVEDVASITIADFSRVVRLTGTLTGEPISNDSYQYWDLDLGNSNMVEFRSGNPNRMTGQRITWVGPVGTVAGIPFLTELNSDWVMVTE